MGIAAGKGGQAGFNDGVREEEGGQILLILNGKGG
jgi:hypothetical protein